MKKATAIVKDSFKITRVGPIVFLCHKENGLPSGTKLTSEDSGLVWHVSSRILYSHAAEEQRLFDSESTVVHWLSFGSFKKRTDSIELIKQREEQSIFDYVLKPSNHEEKPIAGEELLITFPDEAPGT